MARAPSCVFSGDDLGHSVSLTPLTCEAESYTSMSSGQEEHKVELISQKVRACENSFTTIFLSKTTCSSGVCLTVHSSIVPTHHHAKLLGKQCVAWKESWRSAKAGSSKEDAVCTGRSKGALLKSACASLKSWLVMMVTPSDRQSQTVPEIGELLTLWT